MAQSNLPPEAIILHRKPVDGVEGTGTSSHTYVTVLPPVRVEDPGITYGIIVASVLAPGMHLSRNRGRHCFVYVNERAILENC